MGYLGILIGGVLPWFLGFIWLCYFWRRTPGHSWMLDLGYGYLLGMVFTTLLMRLLDGLGWKQDFPVLIVILGCLTAVGIWLSYGKGLWPWTIRSRGWRDQTRWQRIAYTLLLALISVRLVGIAAELSLLPLYPWDAWTTWAVKPRIWFEHKELIPFVDARTWLADQTETFYTIEAWYYPRTVSLFQLWMALGYNQWNESINNVPWLFCGIALGLGFYGQARAWNIDPLLGLLFTYLLLSMPIVNTHIALAGYADLWMAAAYGLATLAFFQWLRTGDRRQGTVALVLAAACPLIKVEGAVWLLTFIPALLVACLTLKKLAWIIGILALALGGWFGLGGFSAELPGLGEIHLRPELIQIPHLGQFELGFEANWEPFIQNLFVLDNWHLLWYLFIAVVLVSLPGILRDRLLLACTTQVAAGLAMLFVLFFMTDARLWAERYTSINRLLLHMTPVLAFYLLILVNDLYGRQFDRETASAPQSA